MKSRYSMCFVAIALFAVLAIPIRLAAQDNQDHNHHKHARYTVIDLGTVNGGFGGAAGINNRGWVTDSSSLPGGNVHAFLWRKGALTNLGTLGGPNSFENAFEGVNQRGQVVGEAETSTPDPNGEDFCFFGTHLICLGFVWQNRVMTPLPTLGGNNGGANGVNNRGQIVGLTENSTIDTTCFPPQVLDFEAVIWGPKKGEIHELPPFPGDTEASASAINDRGEAVGTSGNCSQGPIEAVLWQSGSPINLGSLGGAVFNIAFNINNQGQVVGESDTPGDINHHAFLWTKHDGMRDLGLLPGDVSSLAASINSKAQVVGKSDDPSGNSRAFLWQNGVMTDMNTLIPANSPLYLIEALGINDRGQITGYAVVIATGEFHGFLATPCDGKDGQGCGEDAAGTAGTAAAARVSPPPSTQHPTALPPGSRMPIGMLNRLRFPWGQQNPVPGTSPASEQKKEPPSETTADDVLGDHTLAPPCWPPWRCHHAGYCVRDESTGKLTGDCVGSAMFFRCALGASKQCPKGRYAKNPNYFQCGEGFPWPIDLARKCTFR